MTRRAGLNVLFPVGSLLAVPLWLGWGCLVMILAMVRPLVTSMLSLGTIAKGTLAVGFAVSGMPAEGFKAACVVVASGLLLGAAEWLGERAAPGFGDGIQGTSWWWWWL